MMQELADAIEQPEAIAPALRRWARQVVRENGRRPYAPPLVALTYPVAASGDGAESRPTTPAVGLREARQCRGLSIEALARCSGVSVSTIYRIERGTTRARPHNVHALSEALGFAPWQIIEFRPSLATVGLRRLSAPLA